MKDLIMTCDLGTSSCKCTAFDVGGNVIASIRKEYGVKYPKQGWAQQDVDEMSGAAFVAIKELTGIINPSRVAVIGLSGTMNGCIPVDHDGNALHDNIIHSDARCEKEVAMIENAISFDDFYKLTGNRLNTHYTLPKVLWFRDNLPGVYKAAAYWLNTKDYFYTKLTGKKGVTDYSDASLTIALNINTGKWADELISELKLDRSKFPEIHAGHEILGSVADSVALETGLVAGTPVAIGGGDGACAARGAGLTRPGEAYSYIGSSAWVAQFTSHPIIDKDARVFNYFDMDGVSNNVCGTVQCGAAAFDWAMDNLLACGLVKDADYFYNIECSARSVPAGSEGVLFLPTLMGERTPYWDANTRGCLTGFSLYHDRRHIMRAIYEGVAYALYSCARVYEDNNVKVGRLMLTGGGAKSSLWAEIIASVFNVPTMVHSCPQEATSLGAAIAAGVGIGLYKDYTVAGDIVKAKLEFAPNQDWNRSYERYFETYMKLYPRLKPVFDNLST